MTGGTGVQQSGGSIEQAAAAIEQAGLELVRDDRGVRVEDYLAALAAATGEAALVDGLGFDIESTDLTPGAAVFGDAINGMLTGDVTSLDGVPSTSVVGVLRDRLVPTVVPADAFEPLDHWYRLVASSVGSVAWGEVALTVPDEHRPGISPLRLAFGLRPVVESVAGSDRLIPCALALAAGIERTTEAIDVRIALTLSLEVVFGVAKTVPMSRRVFETTRDQPPAEQ